MSGYHSYHASVLEKLSGKCYVNMVDRYYHGLDRSDYTIMASLFPEEAIELANELKKCAKEAIERQNKIEEEAYG